MRSLYDTFSATLSKSLNNVAKLTGASAASVPTSSCGLPTDNDGSPDQPVTWGGSNSSSKVSRKLNREYPSPWWIEDVLDHKTGAMLGYHIVAENGLLVSQVCLVVPGDKGSSLAWDRYIAHAGNSFAGVAVRVD